MPKINKTSKPTKSTKATSSVKSTKQKTVAPARVKEESVVENTVAAKPSYKKYYIIFAIVLLVGAVYYFKNLFVVALVNGQPISRLALISELEKTGGKKTLTNMVTKTLIEQQAAKKNIKVSDADVNAKLKSISETLSKQGQTLDAALAANGMTKADLKTQLKFQIMLEKLVGNASPVTDKEVDEYIEKNKGSLSETVTPELRASIKEQLSQQGMNTKVETYISDLQKKAKVDYLVNY
ncbi:hypothetical protein HGA88_01960 [Candidatus Roizmanbacteria bacterium]|nr:hypothetical protein [Candidatus Roizmanbacteria bacterium]